MPSICQQVVDRVVAVITAATDAGGNVFDSRAEALAREESPSILVEASDEETKAFSDAVDENEFAFNVGIMVRDDAWRGIAEAIAVDVDRLLMRDATLRDLVTRLRRTGKVWEGDEADATAGALTVKYTGRYLSPVGDMTTSL